MSKFTVTPAAVLALAEKIDIHAPKSVDVSETQVISHWDFDAEADATHLFFAGLGVLWDYDGLASTQELYIFPTDGQDTNKGISAIIERRV